MAASFKIKLSPAMRPYVGRVVRGGAVQKAFAEQIGRPVGACVASSVRRGMSSGQIKQAVRDCARSARGTRLNLASASAHR
jgi:hypothetical protein